MTNAHTSVAHALLAIGNADIDAARQLIARAVEADPTAMLPRALANALADDSKVDVYAEPSGFEDFINNGGNPALYTATVDALRAIHAQQRPGVFLDVGCGDGRVTFAVHDQNRLVELVEPSPALLDTAVSRFLQAGIDVTSWNMTAQEALSSTEHSWDLVQSTFAMHALAPNERKHVLHALAQRTTRLLIVEFDVPDFVDRSIEHAMYAAATFENGLLEYTDHPQVHTDFLLPVLVNQFDPAKRRHTHEQSAAAWKRDLVDAGWGTVDVQPLADYWWAPAVLFDAQTN